MCYLKKNLKKLLQFTFQKKIVVQKERKNNLTRGKISAPLPRISNVLSLIHCIITAGVPPVRARNTWTGPHHRSHLASLGQYRPKYK